MGLFNIFKKNNKKKEFDEAELAFDENSNNATLAKDWTEVSNFEYNKPCEGVGITKIANVELPKDYLDFMHKHNGGEGNIGLTWLVLYPLEKLEEINNEFEIGIYLPNSIIIGSNGAGELYGINAEGEYFNVPEVIEEEHVTLLGKDFNKLPDRINKFWKQMEQTYYK